MSLRFDNIGYDPPAPDPFGEIVLRNDPASVLDQIEKEAEHLRLELMGPALTPELNSVGIEFGSRLAPWASWVVPYDVPVLLVAA